MRATVGVVVTGFDQGDLVREAVESVLRQTRAPDQVLGVDDGSTDARSRAVLDVLAEEGWGSVLRQGSICARCSWHRRRRRPRGSAPGSDWSSTTRAGTARAVGPVPQP
ncbi:glycosyltransferase family 2 protein [Oerskovia sp. NPDC057915]|uniref:glycosyltransferase family 2 protein n=1 Tax=Oerskovia sp. NPDC057915 TaxID=3346280 RepID=UPI0036D7EC85